MRERRGGRARARPPFCMARRGLVEIEREAVNWAAARAEYVAGGVSQAALARKYGVSVYALRKRAGAEGWAAAKKRGAVRAEEGGTGKPPWGDGPAGGDVQDAGPAPTGDAGFDAPDDSGGDIQVARRARMALLQMLERAAATIPCDATEVKTTGDGGEVRLLKLRDLTAAYKELAGDLPAGDADGGSQVVIDL